MGLGLGFCNQGVAFGNTPKVEGQVRDHPSSTENKPVGSQLEFRLRPLINSRFGDSLEEGDTALLPRAMPKEGVEPPPSDWKCLGFCLHQGDPILTHIEDELSRPSQDSRELQVASDKIAYLGRGPAHK